MDVARRFTIGEGTVQKISDQVITAICSLEREYLSWYSSSQITEMKARIYQQSGFLNCIGFLDGTTIVFAEKPVKEGEAYYSRKSDYGINSQIIADLDGYICYIFTGYPASVHDSQCVHNSNLFKALCQGGLLVFLSMSFCLCVYVYLWTAFFFRPCASLKSDLVAAQWPLPFYSLTLCDFSFV